MKEVEIKFTKDEAQAVINLIDIAVKSKGLEVAETSIYILKKLDDAFKPKNTEEKESLE